MEISRILILISPMVVGLVLPAILGSYPTVHRSLRAGLITLGISTGVGFLIAGLCGLTLGPILKFIGLLLIFQMWIGGTFYLLIRFKLGPQLAQLGSSFLVLILIGTPFYMNPILEGSNPDSIYDKIYYALLFNPHIMIAKCVLDIDVLHLPYIYTRSLLSQYYVIYPSWGEAMVHYAAFTLLTVCIIMITYLFFPIVKRLCPGIPGRSY
jgi:hypothetical protein